MSSAAFGKSSGATGSGGGRQRASSSATPTQSLGLSSDMSPRSCERREGHLPSKKSARVDMSIESRARAASASLPSVGEPRLASSPGLTQSILIPGSRCTAVYNRNSDLKSAASSKLARSLSMSRHSTAWATPATACQERWRTHALAFAVAERREAKDKGAKLGSVARS